MNFKIDTKEKFQELYLLDEHISANMTDQLQQILSDLLVQAPTNVIISLESVLSISPEVAFGLAEGHGKFYEAGHSFVLCHLQPAVEKTLADADIVDGFNITPTLSEAWDIVQMEEIERELLGGFEE